MFQTINNGLSHLVCGKGGYFSCLSRGVNTDFNEGKGVFWGIMIMSRGGSIIN